MSRNKVSPYTDFLYARPSLLEGIGRIADFFGTMQKYNKSSSPEAADRRAIYADWAAVGGDMWVVIKKANRDSSKNRKR